MNSDSHAPHEDGQDLEARIVALVLGEASDFEATELERILSEHPERTRLEELRQGLEHMHGLLTKSGAEDRDRWKLSRKRRRSLLKTFQQPPAESAASSRQSKPEGPESAPSRLRFKRHQIWLTTLSIAAALLLVFLTVPLLMQSKSEATDARSSWNRTPEATYEWDGKDQTESAPSERNEDFSRLSEMDPFGEGDAARKDRLNGRDLTSDYGLEELGEEIEEIMDKETSPASGPAPIVDSSLRESGRRGITATYRSGSGQSYGVGQKRNGGTSTRAPTFDNTYREASKSQRASRFPQTKSESSTIASPGAPPPSFNAPDRLRSANGVISDFSAEIAKTAPLGQTVANPGDRDTRWAGSDQGEGVDPNASIRAKKRPRPPRAPQPEPFASGSPAATPPPGASPGYGGIGGAGGGVAGTGGTRIDALRHGFSGKAPEDIANLGPAPNVEKPKPSISVSRRQPESRIVESADEQGQQEGEWANGRGNTLGPVKGAEIKSGANWSRTREGKATPLPSIPTAPHSTTASTPAPSRPLQLGRERQKDLGDLNRERKMPAEHSNKYDDSYFKRTEERATGGYDDTKKDKQTGKADWFYSGVLGQSLPQLERMAAPVPPPADPGKPTRVEHDFDGGASSFAEKSLGKGRKIATLANGPVDFWTQSEGADQPSSPSPPSPPRLGPAHRGEKPHLIAGESELFGFAQGYMHHPSRDASGASAVQGGLIEDEIAQNQAGTISRAIEMPPDLHAHLASPKNVAEHLLPLGGLALPAGTHAKYNRELQQIEVHGTVENIQRVQGLIENKRRELDRVKQQLESIPEKLAAEEAWSTFSLHVSDVSFKLASQALAQGTWPEPNKIRPEEFVNAMHYGDPTPSRAQKISCRVDHAAHPFRQSRDLFRIGLRTAAEGRNDTQGLHLTLLLDVSGSMEREDRTLSLRAAIRVLATLLKQGDTVTLIGFARTPRLIVDALPGERASELVALVDQTPSEGGTNLEAALALASEKARQHFHPSAINRIVLLTDGAANLGDARPDVLAAQIEALREQHIAFDACGVGADDLNDTLLEALARKGDGRYYVLNRPIDADAGFARQLAGALRPSAKNVKVQVYFNPERVGRYRLIGYEKHRLKKEDFRNDAVDAAEMAAAESGVAVYEVEVLPEGKGPIGKVSVRFRDLASDNMVEQSWPLVHCIPEPFEHASAPLQLAGTAAFFAERLKGGAPASAVDLSTLAEAAKGLELAFPNQTRVQTLSTMIDQARRLEP